MVDAINEKLTTLPDKSGVYIMRNAEGEIIYVGKAKVLKNRVRQYFKNHNHPPKVRKMVENIADFEYIITDSEKEALILENNLIKENMPKYNILLKDDKTYPFIKITLYEDYPRILITRRVIRDGSRYFGPYCGNFNLKELVDTVSDIYGIRKCNKVMGETKSARRVCLYHQMGKCSGACTGEVNKDEYMQGVNNAISFFNGKYADVIEKLTQKMKLAAANLDFETAAECRDKIKSVSQIGEKQKIVSATGSDCDAIAVYNSDDFACIEVFFIRSGKIVGREHYFLQDTEEIQDATLLSQFMKQYYEDSTFIPHSFLTSVEPDDKTTIEQWLGSKLGRGVNLSVPKIGDKLKLINMIHANAKKEHRERMLKIMRDISFKDNALLGLRKLIGMDSPPLVIEAYDISNTSGKDMVGAMVTFVNGKPLRERYRNYKIKYVIGQDDYACMREVVERRILRGINEKNNDSEVDNKFLPFPDLMLIDGGSAHVDAVLPLIKKYNLPIHVLGIVKDDNHRTRGLVSPTGEINIDTGSEAFMLLTQIQDEMHRRAIDYHRRLREGSSLKSKLTAIKGVGDKKAKILFKHFKSISKLRNATLEEIISVPGIDKTTAQNVFDYFTED